MLFQETEAAESAAANVSEMDAADLVQTYVIHNGPNVLWAVVTLVVGWWVVKIITGVARRVLEKRLDTALAGFLSSLLHALLLTLVVLSALDRVGVPTTSFIAVIGAAGLAVGFALQGSLSNFAAGVMLVFFRPFKAGDLVEVAGTLGVVEEIQIFATMLVSLDNKKIVVPNNSITSNNIINYSGKATRRVDMVFGISYGDDIKKAKEIMREVLEKNPHVLKDPAYNVAVSELGDSSVNFVVRPWCKTEDYWACFFSVTEEVKLALEAGGITIPFPQRDVHMHQVA